MKKIRSFLAVFLAAVLILPGCHASDAPAETTQAIPAATEALAASEVTVPTTLPPETQPPETEPPIVLEFTEEETRMLLKIGMAELGHTGCETCIALVMCTVLNRVNADRFGSSIYSVLHAQDQFTPVMDGTYETAEPNDACRAALDMVIRGWDESQGAFYYEFCEGESWHSKNLQLLTEHCNTRFYK